MYKDMMDTIGFVSGYDPELGAAMQRELGRQQANIELIASENIVSPAVMAAMGSVLTNKYAEGYPGHRYYGGCQFVDQVEQIAIDRACKLFGAKYANVQPHSGAQANLAVYFALLNLGDTVMGMDLSQGGHLTHGSPANMSGKNYNFVSYGVSAEDGRIDYDALAKQVAKVRPKLLVAGASAYPRAIDFARLLLKSCEALKVAMGEFRNFKNSKKLPALIVKVGDAEEEMDSLFFTAMHGLYKESREDALDIFIWDKLFQRMENTADTCERASDIMDSIIMKYA